MWQFDYLLVFPITEGTHASRSIADSNERIDWAHASTIWKAAVFGTDERKYIALKALAEHWKMLVSRSILSSSLRLILADVVVRGYYQRISTASSYLSGSLFQGRPLFTILCKKVA
jgi:hypothetical protein